MANYVKFKQGLKKDFNTTNQPLTNGMIYFVIDEKNNGSIYYDTIVDGAQAIKKGTVHRVKFSGLPIKITGSVTGTGVISKDGESIEINTSTNHSHGLAHQNFTVALTNDDTNLKWTRLGDQNGGGFWLKSIRGQTKAPAWFLPDFSAGIAFGGSDTKGIISVKYSQPGIRFAGGNGDAPVWYFTITGANDKTYDLSKIGGHSSDSAKLDHNVTFKIASTANATNGANGTKTDLSGSAVNLYLPTKISGFDLLQASRFQGNADSATHATNADNADTTDGVHLEWSGEQAASATDWIAGWSADGKKIKPVRRSALATKNSDVAAKLGQSGNVAIPMTFYWNIQGGQPNWIWGGNDGTNMYIYSPSNFSVSNAGYIRSMGDQKAESGRTAARGGVYTYNMYDQTANGAPTTNLSVVGFGNGTGGHIEIAGQWTGNSGLWMRGLRDCCDDWYSWNRIWCQGNSVTGAVWNDYAECRQSDCSEPGRVVFEKGDDTLTKTKKRLQHFAGVISDTWGFSQGETDKAKTNIAVAGRVLVYTYQNRNNYKPGDCVCAAPDGTIDIMTREEIIKFPDRIVGIVSCVPDYEEWGGGKNADRDPAKINGRIWIKVK